MITYGSTTLTSYNTITKIEVYYYKSTSATDLAGGSWSTTKPTWENGKYIWQKIKTTYEGKLENGQFYSESDPVNITGQQGATGIAAYSYKLNASDSVIGKTKTGEYTIDKITFTATYKQGTGAVTAYTGRFKIETTANGTTWTTQYTSSGNESSKEFTIPENIISVRCSLYQSGGTSTLLDITTVPVVKDGIDAVGLRDSIPYYLASDKQTGVTRLDQGWTRFKPELTTEKRYLWVYYVSRYSEGDTQPELIEIKNDIVSFENHGDESPVENCVIDIEPVQDLHGYDSPWPGGGGKNLFNSTLLSESSSWVNLTISVKPDTVYTMSTNKPSGTGLALYFNNDNTAGGSSVSLVSAEHPVTVTSTSEGNVYVSHRRSSGEDLFSNYQFQIEEGSTATDYAPYSNICPITGWTEINTYNDPLYDRTIDWNQLAYNGDFSNNADEWGESNIHYRAITIEDGKAKITPTQDAPYIQLVTNSGFYPKANAIKNHKYMLLGAISSNITITKVTGNLDDNWTSIGYDRLIVNSTAVMYEGIINASGSADNNFRIVFTVEGSFVGGSSYCYFDNIQLFDLTQMFGTGNEPSTVEEFKALFPNDYYPYSTGEKTTVSAVNGKPYTHLTIDLGQTVYGGTLDVTKGVLTVDRVRYTFTGNETCSQYASTNGWYFDELASMPILDSVLFDNNVHIVSDTFKGGVSGSGSEIPNGARTEMEMFLQNTPLYKRIYIQDSKAQTTADIQSLVSGSTVILPLAIPVTYHLTPQEITMLTGQNHIFSDTGQTSISYYDNQTSTDPYVDYSATSTFEVAQSVSDAVGTLQAPYKEVEWVESTGKQYVYLDWKPPIKTWGFEIDFISKNGIGTSAGAWNETTNVNGYGTIFGVRSSSGVNNAQLSSYNNGLLRIGTGNNIVTGFKTDHTRQTIKLHNSTLTKTDGTTTTVTRTDENTSKPYCGMTIFGLYEGLRRGSSGSISEPSSTRIYSLKFYDGDTLTVDLVGAIRKTDNVTGLYDKVSKHFYPAPGMLFGNDVGDIITTDTISDNLNKTDVKATVVNKNRSRMWEANVPFSKLEDGQKLTITYSYGNVVSSVETSELIGWDDTSSNSNVYLKLTYPNGDTSEWIPCYYSNTARLTTHYGSGTPITFTYHENLLQNATETAGGSSIVRGFFANPSYYNNTSYTQYSNNVKAGANGVKCNSLIMQDGEDTWSCFYSGAYKNTNTGKPAYTGGFRLGKVLYSAGSGAQTSNSSLDTYYNYKEGVVTSTIYDAYPVDLRYSTNCGTTLTAQRPIYLVGTVESDGLFHLDVSQWWTQTQPTYEDGKIYVYLGVAYSTYQLWLATENPAYVYYNSEFILYDKALTLQNIATLKDSLKTQIDGKVETWCQKTNPALSWDATERPNHTGDLWYYTGESDNTYKNNTTYQYNGSTNTWTEYSANPDLFDRIDGKAAIYYGSTSSVTSAETGDYLVDSSDGSSYRWDGSKWVKVTDYKTAIDTVNDAIVSRGEQLVINGNGMMGSNYNFSSLTFDGSKSNGSPGSFTRPAETISRTIYSDEFFPVTPSNTYVLSFDLMSLNNLSTMYAFINFYDVDKKQIDAEMHMYCPNTLTTLSQDLKNGDTVVHLTDASNWETTGSYNHGLIFWNYVNSFGYQYPEHTYSRNKWGKLFDLSNIDKTNNTITLNEAWNHGTFPTGTKLSQKNAGATFKYLGIVGSIVPNTWTSYKGRIGDIDYSGTNMMGMFPPGTAYAKVGFLWNYNKANDQVWVTNISVKEDVTRGTGFYAITTAPTAYTTQVGNFTPAYRIALSTVKTQSGLEEVMVGDVIQQGYNTYPVGYVDASYVYLGSANSIRGATGATGLNNAQVILYRRFASAPSGTNVAPTGDVTYTFSTGKAANNLNSWTQNIPSGSDPVYMIAASASSTSSTDTIPKTEWSAPVKILENGQDGGTGSAGADGYNQATIFLYQRKSGTAPSKPSSAVTYTFSSGALSSTPTGWSRTIPANNGNPCYVTTATAVAKTATYSIPANGWSDVVILSQDGEDGTSITITSTSVKYQKGTSGTTAPTGTWGTSIPTVGENEFLWTQTIVNYSDNSKTESYSVSRNAKNGTNGTSPTVSSTTVEYQQSTGGTTPPTGTWSTTAPTATAGQYMWTRTTVTYSDSKTAVSYSVSKNGTDGTSPTAYHLIVSHGAINKSQAGVYNPTTVTLTSKYQTGNGALNNYSGRFKIETTTDNNTWTQDSASSTANESSKTYTIPANIKAVRFSLYLAGGFTTLLDQQTVPVVTDGAKGDNGEDAYTIVLTNEAHTFPAGVSAALAGSATSNVMTYKGGVQVACFVGSTSSATSISTGTTGLTCTINDNNSKNVSLTFTATTSLTTRAGTVTIPITVNNKAFSKTFTWSLANQGIKGDDGVSVTNVTSTNNTADGGTSVVTITLSNGATKTFNVKNGSKGSQGDTGATAQWYYGTALTHTSGTATLVATSTSGAVVGSMYLNTQTSLVYKCTAVGTNNTWTYAGDLTTGVIDNLQVGGKNLLLKEPRAFDPTTYNPYQLNLTEPLEANQPYTIQLWDVDVSNDKKTASQLGVNVYYCGGSVTFGHWTGEQYFTDGHADHLILTFTPTEANVTHSSVNNTTGAKYISLYNSVSNVDGSVKNLTVGKWQLEKGNVGTDWTLAPEDVENAIQNAQDKADEAWAATQPLAIKTYNDVTITNNNDPKGWLYFGTVKPTNYNTPWKIRYKVYASIDGITDSYQQSEVMIEGAKDTYYTYRTYNMISNTSYRPLYAYSLYTLKQAGVNNGYGHLIGIRFQSAYWPNSTYTNYKRTIKIEIIESTNCQITLADTMFLYTDASGTGSTNYNTRYSFDGVTQGYTGSGDRNETNHILNNFSGKTGVLGIWQTGLFMRDGNGTYQNICTNANGVISRTVETTKKANTNGFEIGSQIYYSASSYNANSNITGSVYASYGAFDSRYSLNTTLTANCLTPYQPIYLVGTIRTDGLFYLDTVWWTQTATDSSKVYILIGGCYDSTTSYCRINLFEQNNWFKYVDGKLVDYTNRLAELAASTATAYITDTTDNGIMVHPENDTTSGWSIAGAIELFKTGISYIKLWIDNNIPKIRIGKEDSKHVLIDDDSVDIVDDENVLASFGETVQIGRNDANHAELGALNFKLVDKEGNIYFYASDLRENAGAAEIIETFVATTKALYGLKFKATNTNYSVKVSDSSGTISEKTDQSVSFNPVPNEGAIITVTYSTENYHAKAFTMGFRKANQKIGALSFAEGDSITASGYASHAEGEHTEASGANSHAEGWSTQANGASSHAEGGNAITNGMYSHAEGRLTQANEDASHAEGWSTQASGAYSHAEGTSTRANKDASHAEGWSTQASGTASHAEGTSTQASGAYSHAEGENTIANSRASHAEGEYTEANGVYSHAEGSYTKANEKYSHAQNHATIASSIAQTALGKYNIEDTNNQYSVIIGNGEYSNRSNALSITWDGDTEFALDTTASSGTIDADLYDAITALGWNINDITV